MSSRNSCLRVLNIEPTVQKWLLEPEQPVVRYYTLRSLMDRNESDPEVREARSQILKRGWATEILASQKSRGNWEEIEDLYRPKYTATNWRMIVLSDFALSSQDESRLERACQLFFTNKQWLGNEDQFEQEGECCVSGNLARMLTKFGYGDDPRVKRVLTWLVNTQKEDGGWHCFKSDTGTLDCWEALAAFAAIPKPKRIKSVRRSVDRGAEFYLKRELHKEGQKYSPWYRFHYPNHYYYDLLVGLDVLTSLGFADDKRLKFALDLLKKKQLADGTWEIDAMHPDIARGAGYTMKKRPKRFALEEEGKSSKWITLTALKVMKRVEEA